MAGDPFENTNGAVFEVTEAEREQIPGLFAFWGFSSSGKTYSALRFARGLVGPEGNIVLVDTENKRAKLYAGKFGGWRHIDLQPPFSPDRYTSALNTAIDDGANVVIFDSMSHVWEGDGGVIEQAEATGMKGLGKWKAPKMSYKRMTNALFRAPIPVIFCLRAKDKNVQKGRGKDAEIINMGPTPICDPSLSLIYETTVACHMESETHRPIGSIKAPDEIAHIIQEGEFITEEMGAMIADWLGGGAEADQKRLDAQRKARDVATKGTKKFREHWAALKKTERALINDIRPDLKQIAEEADKEIAEKGDQQTDIPEDPFADNYTNNEAESA